MKKISLGLVALALLVSGCGMTSKPAAQSDATTQLASQTDKRYELYEGPIWSAEPVDCAGGIICLINEAEKCNPSKAKFIAEFRDINKRTVRQDYEIGIQGMQFNECQMYYKVTNRVINNKPWSLVGKAPYADGVNVNYQMFRFAKSSDIADILRQGPKDAGSNKLGLGFLEEPGLFSVMFDTNATKNKDTYVKLTDTRFDHTYPDTTIGFSSVRYNLVPGEGIEDASQNFRLVVDSMDWGSHATFKMTKDGKDETFTVAIGEEKIIQGYKLKIEGDGFIEKNVAVSKNLNDAAVNEKAVSFTLGL